MQRKIEIRLESRSYIIKVDDEMLFEDILKIMKIKPEVNYKLFLKTKNRYIQSFNRLKDVGIVNNDIIKVIMENDEKAI